MLKTQHHAANEAQKAVLSAPSSAEAAYAGLQSRQHQQRPRRDWLLLMAAAKPCNEAGRLCLQPRPVTFGLSQNTPTTSLA